MLRAVVDPGVLISALISPRGAPAELIRRWLAGEVQFLWSPLLMDEFESVCRRPRFRAWFSEGEAADIAELLRHSGEKGDDVPTGAAAPSDDGDLYLVDLAIASRADCLVTGDSALVDHGPRLVQGVTTVRIVTPRQVIAALDDLWR